MVFSLSKTLDGLILLNIHSREFCFSSGSVSKFYFQCMLKKRFENNSTWEVAFYQNEWVIINSNWFFLDFSLYMCCCYCIWIVLFGPFSKYWTSFTPFYALILNIQICMYVNSPASADENQVKCEKVRFLSEMKLTQDELFSIFKSKQQEPQLEHGTIFNFQTVVHWLPAFLQCYLNRLNKHCHTVKYVLYEAYYEDNWFV